MIQVCAKLVRGIPFLLRILNSVPKVKIRTAKIVGKDFTLKTLLSAN